jgi:hypothetical protein
VAVSRGQSYNLHSYAFADGQGNFNTTSKSPSATPKTLSWLSTWFVYTPHAFVTLDNDVVFSAPDPNAFVLRVTANTLFKRRPVDNSQLAPNERATASPGTTIVLSSYAFANARGRLTVTFALPLSTSRRHQWAEYLVHISGPCAGRAGGSGCVSAPAARPYCTATASVLGRPFRLPAIRRRSTPTSQSSWRQLYLGRSTREATRILNQAIVDNICLARHWRPRAIASTAPFKSPPGIGPAVNAAVGGASRSQHLVGRAADIQVQGSAVASGQRADAELARGHGHLRQYSQHIHLDTGPKRTWGILIRPDAMRCLPPHLPKLAIRLRSGLLSLVYYEGISMILCSSCLTQNIPRPTCRAQCPKTSLSFFKSAPATRWSTTWGRSC